MSMHIDYGRRYNRLREQMAKAGVKAMVLSKFGSLCYFTDAILKDRGALVVSADAGKDPVVIASNVESSRIAYDTWIEDVRDCNFIQNNPNCPIYSQAIAGVLSEMGVDKQEIGLELDDLTVTEYEDLKGYLPGAKFVNVAAQVCSLMAVKEKAEIDRQRRCAEIVDAGMEAAWAALAVGKKETEIAGAAEFAMRLAGSSSSTYGIGGRVGTEIASGYRSGFARCWSMPPTLKKIQRGDFVTIDIHCNYDLYVADLTLNAVMGPPNKEQQKLADVWKRAVDNLLSKMRPGAAIAEAALSTKKLVEDAGYGEFVSPLFGHGLGTTTRVPPTISETNKGIFEDNMTCVAVVTIARPDVGGMRLELPTLVTKNGGEPLCRSQLDLKVIEL